MRYIIFCLCCLCQVLTSYGNVMLVNTYKNEDLQNWVMSEKLDGIRGYWNGTALFTRNNTPLSPPHYFTQHFPPFAIDGELFSQRNQFEEISSIVRSQEDKGWDKLKLYVFDVPHAEGDLFQRLQHLRDYLAKHPTPYITIIEQIPIQNQAQVLQFLHHIEQQKGEGIIVRDPSAPYETGRSSKILKIKSTLDEECTVIAHHKGKGQFANVLGALTCENHRGQFKIGSGFKLEDRINPPVIGSVITYKYRGITHNGKPRFATFWRERKNE
ncbi:DNA ligase [Conservatibacter flavescens]|uniref:DNA ligase n=1 Tax=Conservatibacter flavescens TaxID=28161 RepID=A0A2M8S2D1_9PAST|nr:DNA ligase [Conservatibacter flavescens]PJG85266.1 DNA ligase [Conservatibacter flavescens]